MTDLSEASASEFAATHLPRYHGPTVKIQIGSNNHEYEISKHLLCKESTYFTAMFESNFAEGEQQASTLKEVDGVVSVRSFEALIQWIYLRRIQFDFEGPEDQISAMIELARLADMDRISNGSVYQGYTCCQIYSRLFFFGISILIYYLTHQHIIWATFLPPGHLVRCILAAASVEGYLRDENYKFVQETQEYPTFGADLLQEVRSTLSRLESTHRDTTFKDPISGMRMSVNSGSDS
ncbi:hypothetical protein N7447_001764 [Penicillium robsamsonii]|uniref:uncharacterized protein n=1 Tax=Penicillium robsamsonii TaxID=1792511 RepID=UPI0025483895|nr:uncharacterized protein N7447_001764 [Penicillium robsamsonii]KAJ5835738.1 hypothetical protein N7447_001764 [Penicillium robsamsonii]